MSGAAFLVKRSHTEDMRYLGARLLPFAPIPHSRLKPEVLGRDIMEVR